MEFIDLSRQRLIKRLSYLTKLHLKVGWISFLQLIRELVVTLDAVTEIPVALYHL